MLKARKGFTLVEILTIISIIAILCCSILLPNVIKMTERSRLQASASQIVDHLQNLRFQAIKNGRIMEISRNTHQLCETDVTILGDKRGVVFYPNGTGTNSKIRLTSEKYECIIHVRGFTGTFSYVIKKRN